MAETIYINPEDDIHSVIEKLSGYPEGVINLVVPSGARILQNIVDAYLLRDSIRENNQEAVIVTNDVMGKVFAERAGIQVLAASAESGEFVAQTAMARVSDIVPKSKNRVKRVPVKNKKTAISRKTSKKTAPKASTPDAAARFFQSYRQTSKDTDGFDGLRSFRKERSRSRRWRFSLPKFIVLILVVTVVLALVVFGKVLPRAEVIIYPVRDRASFSVEVLIDKSAAAPDQERGVIPGEILISTYEEIDEFAASGLENVSSKAKGEITIFNEFSSKAQTFIPSRFESEDGKIFWTTKNVTVPGAAVKDGQTTPGQIKAEVVAADPGEGHNIGPSTFQMPALAGTERFGKVYARSDSSMEGGKIGEAVIVSQQDFDNAIGSLRSLVDTSLSEFRSGLPDELVLWNEAYNEEITDETTTKNVGEPANRFEAKLRVVARAVVFKRADLEQLLDEEINSRLSTEQTILSSSKEVGFLKPPVVDYQEGNIFAALQVKVDVIENLSTETFKRAILKKDKQEIKQILPSFGGIERVEVKLWPFWVKSVPANAERVEVSIFGE